jgi:hypothetical protein
MTPEERSIVSNFLKDLEQFRGTAKDAEAAELIDSAIGRNPDAAYVLVQHAILANRALQNATARIKDLEAQLKGTGSQSSFLGGSPLFDRPSGPWGSASPAPGAYAPSTPPQTVAASRPGGGVASFLESAAMTAAGVAGGALLFQGLSGFLGGHHGLWGGGWDTPSFGDRGNGFPAGADFSSVDDQMGNADPQVADYGGDFGSSDDSIG